MVFRIEEKAVRNGANNLFSEEFDPCLGIVICQIGTNNFAHLVHIVGHHGREVSIVWQRSRGEGAPAGKAYEVKGLSRIHRVPYAVTGPLSDTGINPEHRAAAPHYMLDIGSNPVTPATTRTFDMR